LAAGKILLILGALLTILGTYVFGLFIFFTAVGSGLGFALNIIDIFALDPALLGIDAIIFYLMLAIFIIWLASGVLQLVGLKSKIVGIIFSLFPLGVGIMFLLVFYTTILGPISGLFTLFTIGEHFGGFFPIFVDIGGSTGLAAFFLVGGGALGLIGSILPRD